MSKEVSTFRLYLMRALYLLNFVLLGLDVWPEVLRHQGAWDPLKGVAFSFWAALSALSGLGVRYPVKMLPLLLLQLILQVGIAISSCTPDVVHRPVNRPHPCHGSRGCCGSYWHSLALCCGKLREGPWG